MTPEELDYRIERLVYEELGLQDGEMMTTLNVNEIYNLRVAIRDLVDEPVREATR